MGKNNAKGAGVRLERSYGSFRVVFAAGRGGRLCARVSNVAGNWCEEYGEDSMMYTFLREAAADTRMDAYAHSVVALHWIVSNLMWPDPEFLGDVADAVSRLNARSMEREGTAGEEDDARALGEVRTAAEVAAELGRGAHGE